MNLAGVGELTELEDCWQLVYRRCGHVQYLAKVGLETDALIEMYVRREYAECLLCSLNGRLESLAN